VIGLWKEIVKEVKEAITNREKLEATLVAKLPSSNVGRIESEIDEIDDFVESRIIELQIFSKKRSKQRFQNKISK
jgi:hypothetical protein